MWETLTFLPQFRNIDTTSRCNRVSAVRGDAEVDRKDDDEKGDCVVNASAPIAAKNSKPRIENEYFIVVCGVLVA